MRERADGQVKGRCRAGSLPRCGSLTVPTFYAAANRSSEQGEERGDRYYRCSTDNNDPCKSFIDDSLESFHCGPLIENESGCPLVATVVFEIRQHCGEGRKVVFGISIGADARIDRQ